MMAHSEDASVGLAALRRANGLTQEELAVRAGVGSATVARLEHGEGRPRRATLRVLALVLGCDPTDLLPSTNESPAGNGALAKERDDGAHRTP